MAKTTGNEYKIYLTQKNAELIYSLEYPLVAGNIGAYKIYLDADSITEWNDIGEIGTINITLTNTKTKASDSCQSTESKSDKNGRNYYIFDVPSFVLNGQGKLQISLQVQSKDQTKQFRTIALSAPPEIYPAATGEVKLDSSQYSQLLRIITGLAGGEKGSVLIKDAAPDGVATNDDYYFNWGIPELATEAVRLTKGHKFTLTGAVGGISDDFDGTQDCEIQVSKFDFSKVNEFEGKLPTSVLPDVISSLIFGGTVNLLPVNEGAELDGGTLEQTTVSLSETLIERWKLDPTNYALTNLLALLNLQEKKSEITEIKINADGTTTETPLKYSFENAYFLCGSNGKIKENAELGQSAITANAGDWLLLNNKKWIKIDKSSQMVQSIQGVNNKQLTPNVTGAIEIEASDIGAAQGDVDRFSSEYGYPAYRANRLTNPVAINGLDFDGLGAITNFGYCKSDGNASEKQVEISNFKLDEKGLPVQEGSLICVVFEKTNNASNVTLQIGSSEQVAEQATEAKVPIYMNDQQVGKEGTIVDVLKKQHAYLMVYHKVEGKGRWTIISGVDSASTQLTAYRSHVILKAGEISIEVPSELKSHSQQIFVYLDGELLINPAQFSIDKSGWLTLNNKTPADYDRYVEFVGFLNEKVDPQDWKIAGETDEDGLVEGALTDDTFKHPIQRAKKADFADKAGALNKKIDIVLDGEQFSETATEAEKNTPLATKVDGSENITLKLPKTIKVNLEGNVTGSLTGNATTATTLETSCPIGKAEFNGSKAISLTDMGAAAQETTLTLNGGNSWTQVSGEDYYSQTITALSFSDTDLIIAQPSWQSSTDCAHYKVFCKSFTNQKITFTIPTAAIPKDTDGALKISSIPTMTMQLLILPGKET